MVIALKRFGLPQKFCGVIDAIFEKPQFKVSDKYSDSENKNQKESRTPEPCVRPLKSLAAQGNEKRVAASMVPGQTASHRGASNQNVHN